MGLRSSIKFVRLTKDILHINGKEFSWGMTYEKTLALYASKNLFTGWSAWKNFEMPCSQFSELKTLTCSFRGPALNRPVMQVSFELATIKPKLFQKPHTPYVKHLSGLLGTPQGISMRKPENGQKYNEGYASSSVIYNCKWWLGDILISLSVFGGIRSKNEGEYAAGLYFNWLNEERAAGPYFTAFEDKESELTQDISGIRKVILKYKSRPFYRSHYELQDPHIALKYPKLRTAQLILYTKNLYRTPIPLAEELSDNQIIVFKSEKTNNWCIGNKWEFTPITSKTKLKFIDIKPARGSGATRIEINSLAISDEKDSKNLINLVKTIEELTGNMFEKTFGYDD